MFASKTVRLAVLGTFAVLYCGFACAQSTIIKEDFNSTATTNNWYFFNGACLTASRTKSAATTSPGSPPGCVGDSYYSTNFSGENLVGGFNGTTGSTTTLPDPDQDGALRLTNGCNWNGSNCNNGGHSQNGAIIWGGTPIPTSGGLDITFKTITYRGDAQHNGSTNTTNYTPSRSDGADGMSFFLMDSGATPNIGSWGGSLGYTCNDGSNPDYHGMVGAYLGLGIDEWGNFLNGTKNSLNAAGITTSQLGDNTASGAGQWSNRIGIRGGGSVAWSALSTTYSSYLSSITSTTDQQSVVKYTCASGYLMNQNNQAILDSNGNKIPVPDYPAIAYYNLPQKIGGVPVVLADEYTSGGYSSQKATPITYHLKITSDAKLSLQMSFNGGSYTTIIQSLDISSLAGESLPADLNFGFAGSTGGSSNIHEVLCFREEPLSEAASSTTVNQQQSSRVINDEGAQAYFGYFDPTDWSGRLTANTLSADKTTGALSISALGNWDASCVLTGTGAAGCPTTGVAGATSAQAWSGTGTGTRVILTWNGSTGVPFEWANLTTGTNSQQSALNGSDSNGQARLNFLRGYRKDEITSTGSGLFRDRDSVLGDIMDSSSAWVGPPSRSQYTAYEVPNTWKDRISADTTGDTIGENSGQTYTQYVNSSAATRLNVVYVGANDGMLHGFSAGSFTSPTSYDSSTNTGLEVLAFMPAGVLQSIHNTATAEYDYPGLNYSHAFSVDATPGASDLFYNGTWHTWLVGGLGAGGSEIYALDVTTPSTFSESNASTLVMGDWTSSTLSCYGNSSCGNNLGNTYGTPLIRRLHNGDWGIIFGNGLPSSTSTGDAGIYIITLDPSSGKPSTIYYLSTGVGSGDGIAYAHPADLDGDHIVDYVYAGDMKGNVWRFDLTSSDPTKWAVTESGTTPAPIFTTSSGQPITSDVYPVKVTGTGGATMMMLYFGTGQKFPLTYSSATTYATGTQSIYGVWDWNMSGWNSLNSTQYASLTGDDGTSTGDTVKNITSLSSPYTLGPSNLTLQGPISQSSGTATINSTNLHTVCWAGAQACGTTITSNAKFGWYVNLPGSNSGSGMATSEQIVYNPQLISTAIQFNSILPAIDSPLTCAPLTDTGWSYAFDTLTGGPVNSAVTSTSSNGTTTTTTTNFFNNGNTSTVGVQNNASGSSSVVTTTNPGTGATEWWMIYQGTGGGPGGPQNIVPPNNISGYRETWVQLR